MKGTANTSAEGSYCGRAVYGVSNLSIEDMHQIEAHRAKERPTPWAHLARRYAVNEIDLRQLFHPKSDATPRPSPKPPVASTLSEREARFRTLWTEGASKSEITALVGMSFSSIDKMRRKLSLPKRREGAKPNGWSQAEDDYILAHYIKGGETSESVAATLGRTRLAVVGRAHRNGWTRKSVMSGGLNVSEQNRNIPRDRLECAA